MDFLKALFADGPLSFEDLKAKLAEKDDKGVPKYKLVNLTDGEYVDKGKLQAAETRINDLTGQLTQRSTDLETLKATAKDSTALTAQIETMKATYAANETALQKKVAAMEREFKVTTELLNSGLTPKMSKAAMALLDGEAMKEDLSGLAAEITRIKTDYSEIFGGGAPGGTGASGHQQSEDDYSKMTDAEYYAAMEAARKKG